MLTHVSKEKTVQSGNNGGWNGCKNRSKFPYKSTDDKNRWTDGRHQLLTHEFRLKSALKSIRNLPRMEKNIMNPAEICTTLRLPTRVNARRPAFSLKYKRQ